MTNAYDFDFVGIDGSPLPLKRFEGQAMMVVNVASKCGFTPQYTGLQKIYGEYRDRGFTVVGVPSNQFMWQEPARETEIAAFCAVTYAVTFPMTGKTHVKGGRAHPFYRWMRERLGRAAHPAWNFHKLLVDKTGQPAGAFATRLEPDGTVVRRAIEAVL
ncbi:MAG: glutathione peroxidase [Alphaproteobacteria bacterium]|nr:glutathione peroxidase [Alphaproteobacteria bacterium]